MFPTGSEPCYRSGRLPRRWHAIGMQFVRMVAVRMGFGCGIDGAAVFDCGELLPIYQSVVVGLWLRLNNGDRFESGPRHVASYRNRSHGFAAWLHPHPASRAPIPSAITSDSSARRSLTNVWYPSSKPP